MAGQPGNQNAAGHHIYPANRASRSGITGTRYVPVVTKFASGKQVVQARVPAPLPPSKPPHAPKSPKVPKAPKPVKVHKPAKPKVHHPGVKHPRAHHPASHHPRTRKAVENEVKEEKQEAKAAKAKKK